MQHRPVALALAAALALATLAAAPAGGPEPDRGPDEHADERAHERVNGEASAPQARVVVAPIDSGINPYHQAFQVEESAVTPDVIDEFDAEVLDITDDYGTDVDDGVYDGLELEQVYHFPGTNILATSTEFGERPLLPDDEFDTHGTGVAGAIAAANPEAIILFVEGVNSDSEEYAFGHAGVDIVTTSYGFVTSAPLGNLADSYAGVVEQGKLHFGASANDPTLSPTDGTSGPWWAIGIAGYGEYPEGDGGKESLSGSAPDFVADFTQDLPYCDTCNTDDTESVSGTSFATPRSAGTMSAILLELRRDAGHVGGITDGLMVNTPEVQVSNWDLRRALERGSYIPESTEVGITETPIHQDAPYYQIGWGAISADRGEVIDRTLDVLAAAPDAPTKSEATCDHMTDVMTARYALWDANPLSDSFGQTNALDASASPYLAC